MSICFDELLKIFDRIAPESSAESWDNGGIQINTGIGSISKLLVCLEITNDVIDAAVSHKTDMILTHHPLIFNELHHVDNNIIIENKIIQLIKNDICVYTMHTSFDSAQGGNNDYLAALLGLKEIKSLTEYGFPQNQGLIGRAGVLAQPKKLSEMIETIKSVLEISTAINFVGEPGQTIKNVALCTGSGADLIPYMKYSACELLITGDVKYHNGQLARELGIAVVDAGHYHTEQIFTRNVCAQLNALTENKIEIMESRIDQNPFHML